jgi:hypothetical protein
LALLWRSVPESSHYTGETTPTTQTSRASESALVWLQLNTAQAMRFPVVVAQNDMIILFYPQFAFESVYNQRALG